MAYYCTSLVRLSFHTFYNIFIPRMTHPYLMPALHGPLSSFHHVSVIFVWFLLTSLSIFQTFQYLPVSAAFLTAHIPLWLYWTGFLRVGLLAIQGFLITVILWTKCTQFILNNKLTACYHPVGKLEHIEFIKHYILG